MIEFPSAMPIDAFMLVVDKIRGKQDVGNRDFAKALWNIVGYATSESIVDDKTIFNESPEVGLEDFASMLEQAVEVDSLREGEERKRLPWASILKTALKILMSVFLL